MATPIGAVDAGGKTIIDGNIRHRHSAIGFQKWRQRYVTFKVTNSGRLQFVIYKESPAIPDNEVKHVAIDEYGGLETNMKLESEKYTFAVITNSSTECFSVDSPQEMSEWTNLLQEYLGKELVLSISIPFKQNVLRAGKAQLRIRNLGFSITTCDSPPRSQGSWQIIHIRKYGGSDFFKFETGSRCPTGECLYTIQTDDNKRVKTLFSELSLHKPIFTDDRVGRRMTLEKSMSHSMKLPSLPMNRFSLPQVPSSDSPSHPLYENRDAIASAMPQGMRRHSAAGTEEVPSPARQGAKTLQNGIPGTAVNIDDNRQYANWTAQRTPGRASPSKKLHPQIQLPVDYYSVVPPPVIQHRSTASNSTPPSSPETEQYLREDFVSPSKKSPDYDYSMVNPSRATIVGDHIMFKEDSSQLEPASNPEGDDMYQNLKFLHKKSTNGPDSDTSKAPIAATQPVVISDLDWAQHNYTNVQLAQEAMHSKKAETPERKSEPFSPSRRETSRKHSVPYTGGLRNSRSTNELDNNPITDSSHPSPDYYNMCVPNLPANNSKNGLHLRTTLSLTSIHQQFNSLDSVDGDTRSGIPGPRSDFERQSRSPVANTYDSLIPLPENKEVMTERYDRLSPLSLNRNSGSSSPDPVLSPTESLNHLTRYQRKVNVTHYHHKYEYVDVDLEHSGESGSSDGVFSPSNKMEHPLTWMSPGPNETPQPESHSKPAIIESRKRVSIKETNSKPRKKQLPLQTTPEDSLHFFPSEQPVRASSEITRKPSPAPRNSRSKTTSAVRRSSSSDESSFEVIPEMETISHAHTTPNETFRPKISNIQVELVRDSVSEHMSPPLLPRNGSDNDLSKKFNTESQLTSSVETPPLPPRPQHHKLPPVNIEIDKKPLPPKPKVLCIPDNGSKKYVSLTFNEKKTVDFDDSTYSAVNVDQSLQFNRSFSEHQESGERVSYSSVNFPITDALHSTIRERMTERANC